METDNDNSASDVDNAGDTDDVDDFKLDADCEAANNLVIEDIIAGMGQENAVSAAEARIGHSAVTKVRLHQCSTIVTS